MSERRSSEGAAKRFWRTAARLTRIVRSWSGRSTALRAVGARAVGRAAVVSCAIWCGAAAVSAVEPARAAESAAPVYFEADVLPVLTKLGCNGGGCHGKASGQNGFRLSLFGFEPDVDYEGLVLEGRGRRVFPAAPERSLVLLKATAALPHGGGRRLEESSEDYRLLGDWIAQGAPGPRATDPRVTGIELEPTECELPAGGAVRLRATARYSDGSRRDVTRRAVYQSNEPGVAVVGEDGTVTAGERRGLAAVMARFGDQIATCHVASPLASTPAAASAVRAELDVLEAKLPPTAVNRALLRQWRRLGVAPSATADDSTFLRRATLDVCGTLPTLEELQAFLTDNRPDKRARLIDRLLERPEYASYFALKWADILQNRGAGYSTSKQRAGTTLFASWIRDSLAANKPYDRFVTEILTASGSQAENPPTIWYRAVRKSPEYVESVAQAFLGVRIQCAQCHHHPTERWSQSDYFGFAAVFGRIGRKGGFADAEVPTEEVIFLRPEGRTIHPRTGETLAPRPLGDEPFALGPLDDPRRSLARWMTAPENPFFARTMANRMWAHFLGRGVVHPIDDARSTNPPSDPELLDALASEFVASRFDVKRLIRTITTSHAYGLDAAPRRENAGDVQTFARFYPRRLSAEVLLDGISQTLDVPTAFPGTAAGVRAIELPDENVAAHFLDVFGRPARRTACECERSDSPALAQALELVNSAEIQRKLVEPTGYAARLAARDVTPEETAGELFRRTLARPARPDELRAAADYLRSEPDRAEAIRSLLWSLLATNEFLFNH